MSLFWIATTSSIPWTLATFAAAIETYPQPALIADSEAAGRRRCSGNFRQSVPGGRRCNDYLTLAAAGSGPVGAHWRRQAVRTDFPGRRAASTRSG